MSDDRRRYPRNTSSLCGVQIRGNLRIEREVSNISSGGVFIQDEQHEAALGDLIVLEFTDQTGTFRVTGEVVYRSDHGVGVQITRANWDRLSKLIT